MTNPKVVAVADQLKLILEAQAGLEATVRELLHSDDLRTAPQDLRDQLGAAIHATINTITERAEATARTMFRMSAALYYLDLESLRGKGEWREIADEEANYRVSVKAIHSIRKSHGLDLREAKYVVEAYQAKLFK